MPDKWITTTPSQGKGKHILLGPNGEIKGGAVPKSAQGKNIREWAAEIKEAPRNIQRIEGESEEAYQKRARKERAALRKKEREGNLGKGKSFVKVGEIRDVRESSGEKEENLRKVPVDHPVEQTVNPIKVRVGFDSNNRE